MTVVGFLTDEKLIEYLDKKVKDELIKHKIYDISSYAWLDQNTENPDYIGHAMWQTEGPNKRHIDELLDGKPVSSRPTDIEKAIAASGEDFYGLMDIARLSIGLCLFFQSGALKDLYGDNHYFWLNYADSMMQLSIASGRIREFFIASFFNRTKDEFKRTHKDRKKAGHFSTPFKDALRIHTKNNSHEKLISALGKANELASEIFNYRKERNNLVHKLATKIGKLNFDVMDQFQKDYDRIKRGEKPLYRIAEIDEIPKLADESDLIQRNEVISSVNILKSWYKDLVKLSNNVFEAEYWYRLKAPLTPKT